MPSQSGEVVSVGAARSGVFAFVPLPDPLAVSPHQIDPPNHTNAIELKSLGRIDAADLPDGFCLVGDAFAFLDPLFSTGVFLALKSGEMAADTIHAALSSGAGQVTAAHFDDYYARQRRAVLSFRQLVRAFYDLSFSFREFLVVYPHLNSLIVGTLVGNVFTDLTPLFTALEEYKQKNPRKEIDVTTA